MDIINTNHLRVSVRFFNRGYGERFRDMYAGWYASRDHGKERLERNYVAKGLGIVAHLKYRPDGKHRVL